MADDELRARAVLDEMQLRISQGPHCALGVGDTVSPEEVRSAFLTLTKQFHPARFGRMSSELHRLANEVFLGIKSAHDVMMKSLGASLRPSSPGRSGGIPVVAPEGTNRMPRAGSRTVPPTTQFARGTDRSSATGSNPARRPPSGQLPAESGQIPAQRPRSGQTAAESGRIPVQRSTGPIPTQRSTGPIPAQVPAQRSTGPIPSQRPTDPIPSQRRSTGPIPAQVPAQRSTGPIPAQVSAQRSTGPLSSQRPPSGQVPVQAGPGSPHPTPAPGTLPPRTNADLDPGSGTAQPRGAFDTPTQRGLAPAQPSSSAPPRAARPSGEFEVRMRGATPSQSMPAQPGRPAFDVKTVRGISPAAPSQQVPAENEFDEHAALLDALKLLDAKHWTAARSALHALAAKVPQSKQYRALLCYSRGREAHAAGRNEDALLEYQRALQLDPELAQVTQAVAELQRRR